MQRIKTDNQDSEQKTYENNKIRSQKNKIDQPENDTRKIDDEHLQLYGLVKKATEKLDNQISNFRE